MADSFHVLVIDDNDLDREITARQLSAAWPFEHELTTDFASDGSEALRKMRETSFALIVLDWKLSGMAGSEVLRHIRQLGIHIPVIVLSGLQRHQIPDDVESHGAVFLNKDEMTSAGFRAAVSEALRLAGLTPAETAR